MSEDLDAQLNVKMPKRLLASLREIEEKHGISPADALRRLGDEMVAFYRKNGWFSFPVFLLPDAEIKRRVKPLPTYLNVWGLNPQDSYTITDDKIVQGLLDQLGLPNLFAQATEHDEVHLSVAFDNHPTHWLTFDFFKGSKRPKDDGLLFGAYPKASVSREEMLRKLQSTAAKMGARKPFNFSQIPILEGQKTSNQTATTATR